MKLKIAAVLATLFVIIAGFLMIMPLFYGNGQDGSKQQIMLSFTVTESNEYINWCSDLSDILKVQDISATVFIQGKVAEQNPESVSCFGNKIDIGSVSFQ